jgi:succinate dehydrogenase cytochrome b556 subunit
MTIVAPRFGFLIDTEVPERATVKPPPSLSLANLFRYIPGRKARMKDPEESQGIGAPLLPILEKLPVFSRYAKTRGWYYVISWLHRFTGIWLFIAMMVHIYTLSACQTANVFNADMQIPARPIFIFLAWTSSLVVSFHALNGGRLILYELFGKRSDEAMIRRTFGLSVTYAAIVGLLMIMKNQSVSAFFFWLMTFCIGAVTAYAVECRIAKVRHSLFWKLQRISGAFLFTTIPAYLIFLYLNPVLADGAQTGIVRLQYVFIRVVTLSLAVSALYHAGYGLFSIAADYASSRTLRTGVTALIIAVIALLTVLAFRFILSV